MVTATKREIREFKGRAQRLKAMFKVGRAGLTPEFIKAVDGALRHHDLLKVKFEELKEQKHELAAQIADQTASLLVTIVGNVAVFHRPRPVDESCQPSPEIRSPS
jgi:RNA-binding protein